MHTVIDNKETGKTYNKTSSSFLSEMQHYYLTFLMAFTNVNWKKKKKTDCHNAILNWQLSSIASLHTSQRGFWMKNCTSLP